MTIARPVSIPRSPRPTPMLAKLLQALADEGAPHGLFDTTGTALRKAAVSDPMGALTTTIATAAAIFYAAEKGKNPKVLSFHDALVFVSTNCSVGYSDIFAKTKLGKLVASFVMTVGPSLTARALDAPEPREKGHELEELLASQRALTASVDALVRALAAKEPRTTASRTSSPR